jgi:hypothetical protein
MFLLTRKSNQLCNESCPNYKAKACAFVTTDFTASRMIMALAGRLLNRVLIPLLLQAKWQT